MSVTETLDKISYKSEPAGGYSYIVHQVNCDTSDVIMTTATVPIANLMAMVSSYITSLNL